MHISDLTITGYKLFGNETTIHLKKGINVLIGENGCGKSAVVDALRVLLCEDEQARIGTSVNNFYRSLTTPSRESNTSSIVIKAKFDWLNEDDQATFLPWLDASAPEIATLNVKIENKEDRKGNYKKTWWGGEAVSGIFEWELIQSMTCVYLPPLRNAEEKLRAYRGSRLARLLKNLKNTEEGEHPLEVKVNNFNKELLRDSSIKDATEKITKHLHKSVGTVFGQDATIQFSEVNFERIVERLKLLFYPILPKGNPNNLNLFRELEENSLGYNNILYLSIILAEFEGLVGDHSPFKVLLIEEPEAHLHPQLQIRLLQYLQLKAEEDNIQILITTHSPTIAAAVKLESIISLNVLEPGTSPVVNSLANCGIDEESGFFVERWLDVTKSTLLFSKGVILVEGIAEGLVIPELGKIICKELNFELPEYQQTFSLEENGVSVISLGGIYFDHFLPLFKGYTLNDDGAKIDKDSLPIRCACITDCDPGQGDTPTEESLCECGNSALGLIPELETHSSNCRMYSNLKTFEYDLAMESNNLKILCAAALKLIKTHGPIRTKLEEAIDIDWTTVDVPEKAEMALWVLNHIDKGEFAQQLAHALSIDDSGFIVPSYIRNAIQWVLGKEERV